MSKTISRYLEISIGHIVVQITLECKGIFSMIYSYSSELHGKSFDGYFVKCILTNSLVMNISYVHVVEFNAYIKWFRLLHYDSS